MVYQSLAEVNFDPDKQEISVLSSHKFCGNGKKIVGAVSVLFIQNDRNLSTIDKDTSPCKNQKTKIPTSLSVIYLPQFEDASDTDYLSDKKASDNASSQQSNLHETFGDSLTKTFVENLETCNQNDEQNKLVNVEDKNPSKEIQTDESTTVNTCTQCGHENISIETESRDKLPTEHSIKVMVDMSTNTDEISPTGMSNENQKKYVDASTNVSLDIEDGSSSVIPVKRKRTESQDSITIVNPNENECASMFIVTENKSSSEDDSASQDSVELDTSHVVESQKSFVNTKSKLPYLDLFEKERSTDSKSNINNEMYITQETDKMDIDDNRKEDGENKEYGNPGNVSIVDLSNVPVSYSNLSPQVTPGVKHKRKQDNPRSVYRASANVFSSQSGSSFNTKSSTSSDQPQQVQNMNTSNQKPKLFRSPSLSKGIFKNTVDKCKICKRPVASLADMFHHSRIHNMGIKCCVCGMKAFDWSVMKHHYTWHIQRAAFKCPQCSMVFGNRELLTSHMKIHAASKSMPHLKNSKLRPPAAKLIVQANKSSRFENAAKFSTNARLSLNAENFASLGKSSISTERDNFVPFRQHLTQTSDQSFEVDKVPNITSKQFDSMHSQNVNQILNYSCGCCDEKFVNVEKLKRHVLMFHSEQTMSGSNYSTETKLEDSSYSMYENASSKLGDKDHSSSSSTAATYTPPDIVKIKEEAPEIIDIEQLGQFTESMENSMSTSSSDQIQMPDPETIEQDIMSSFMDTSLGKQSPTNRQRKTACRLANIIPVCRLCGIYLNDWSEILDHRFSHPEEIGQLLACTVCTSVLSTRDSLKRHAINHMGIRHQCYYCHHEYSRKDSLMNHMRSAHGHSNQ